MNDQEADQLAGFFFKLFIQIVIVVVFGVFILTFHHPKVMLPLWVIVGVILVSLTQYS